MITVIIFHMGLAFNCQRLPDLVVTNNRLLRRSGENFSPPIKVPKTCGSPREDHQRRKLSTFSKSRNDNVGFFNVIKCLPSGSVFLNRLPSLFGFTIYCWISRLFASVFSGTLVEKQLDLLWFCILKIRHWQFSVANYTIPF